MSSYWDLELLEFLNLENIKYSREVILKKLIRLLDNANKRTKEDFEKICQKKSIRDNHYIKAWHKGMINFSSYKLLTRCMLNLVLEEFKKAVKQEKNIYFIKNTRLKTDVKSIVI